MGGQVGGMGGMPGLWFSSALSAQPLIWPPPVKAADTKESPY